MSKQSCRSSSDSHVVPKWWDSADARKVRQEISQPGLSTEDMSELARILTEHLGLVPLYIAVTSWTHVNPISSFKLGTLGLGMQLSCRSCLACTKHRIK